MPADRALDLDEETIFAAAREGARQAIDSAAATAEIHWDAFEEPEGSWPQYVLRAARGGAPGVAVWLWPNERRRGNAFIAALCIGDPASGMVCDLSALSLEELAEDVSRTVEAVVAGRVTYRPEVADDWYDEADEGALVVVLRFSSLRRGDWGLYAVGYLEDPVGFRAATRLPIDEQIGETHPVPAFPA